jgi:hypothetical protein
MKRTIIILSFLILGSNFLHAQFYIGAFGGFKASGLKGTIKLTSGGQTQIGSVADAGNTGFNTGITTGYQVIPYDVTGGLYKLDLNLDVSWSLFNYFEEGWNNVNGSGNFNAQGASGGSTNVFSFDVMPLHRFNFSDFVLSPFAGLGLSVNLLSTSDISVPGATITGMSETKIGLLLFYGTLFNLSSIGKPYVQFKHLIPFGSETQFTESVQAAQGGGTQSQAYYISDVPGYFNITAGMRFNL